MMLIGSMFCIYSCTVFSGDNHSAVYGIDF